MVVIEPYSKELESQHKIFAKKYWSKRRRFTPKYIYWKFRGIDGHKLNSFLLAKNESDVIGQFGIIPCQLQIEDKVYNAQWACDLMVEKNYRGMGIASKLYNYAHKSSMVTIGSDPSPAAQKSMLRSGYLNVPGPRKFIFPVKIGEVFKLKGVNNKMLNLIFNPFLLIVRLSSNKGFTSITTDDYLKLIKRDSNKYIYCVYDQAFSNWRFKAFASYYKGIDCYKKDNNNFFSGFYNGGIYYITDFNCSGLKQFISIIHFVYSKHKAESISRVKFFCNDAKLAQLLPFFGFIRFRSLTNIVLYTTNEIIKKNIANKKFYYTLLDSDENI